MDTGVGSSGPLGPSPDLSRDMCPPVGGSGEDQRPVTVEAGIGEARPCKSRDVWSRLWVSGRSPETDGLRLLSTVLGLSSRDSEVVQSKLFGDYRSPV